MTLSDPTQPPEPSNTRTMRCEKCGGTVKDLMGHAFNLGLKELSEVFEKAFDWDVRNAIAHADYTFAEPGMRLRRRNGGQIRIIKWEEFDSLINRGLNLFSFIRQIVEEYVKSYHPPNHSVSDE